MRETKAPGALYLERLRDDSEFRSFNFDEDDVKAIAVLRKVCTTPDAIEALKHLCQALASEREAVIEAAYGDDL